MVLLAGERLEHQLAGVRAALDGRAGLVFFAPEDAEPGASVARAAGLLEAGTSPLMLAVLDPQAPQDPAVTRVSSGSELEEALGALCAAFELERAGMRSTLPADPGVDVWMLRDGGAVVSALVATADADGVGIYAMGTPAHHARHGYGRRLLADVLGRAARDGATWAYLGATTAGLPLYRSLGFKTVAELQVWVLGSSTQFDASPPRPD